MEKRTIRRWQQDIGIPVIMLMMCTTLATGCSQDNEPESDDGDLIAVSFTATVNGATLPHRDNTHTTADGDEWVANDEVGIFMLTTDGSLTTADNRLANNVKHKVTPGNPASGASFTPATAGETIYYPQSGNVDFVAYYPYTGTTGNKPGEITIDYKYIISVTNQSTPADIDVLYAQKTDVTKSNPDVNLEFSHVLSKITLNVKGGDGFTASDISNIATSEVMFGGMPVTAELALQDGTLTTGTNLTQTFNPLKAGTATATYDATFSAILVPQPNGETNRTVVFTIKGQPYTWAIPAEYTFEAGNHYVYPITVKKTGITVDTPSITDWKLNDHGTAPAEVLAVVRIKAGTFQMGNTEMMDPSRESNTTAHRVTLTKDFYMGKYPITNSQYAEFLNAKRIQGEADDTYGYIGKNDGNTLVTSSNSFGSSYAWGVNWDNTHNRWVPVAGYDNHPIIFVTWEGAKAYAEWAGGSLPTEAQWEYACRARTTTPWETASGTYGDLGEYAWYSENNGSWGTSDYGTKAVGLKKANTWGLYDMHSNVEEWCLDYCTEPPTDYGNGDVTDPVGTEGDAHVLRGGCFYSAASSCRSSSRSNARPAVIAISYSIGFRVVFNL